LKICGKIVEEKIVVGIRHNTFTPTPITKQGIEPDNTEPQKKNQTKQSQLEGEYNNSQLKPQVKKRVFKGIPNDSIYCHKSLRMSQNPAEARTNEYDIEEECNHWQRLLGGEQQHGMLVGHQGSHWPARLHTHTHTQKHTHTLTRRHADTRTHTHTYTHTYARTQTNTHTHTGR